MFSLIFPRTNSSANNRDTGDVRRHGAHYDVTIMHLVTVLVLPGGMRSSIHPLFAGFERAARLGSERRRGDWYRTPGERVKAHPYWRGWQTVSNREFMMINTVFYLSKKTILQTPQCTCSMSHNPPYKTDKCTFLFWMLHYGIWNKCIVEFVN